MPTREEVLVQALADSQTIAATVRLRLAEALERIKELESERTGPVPPHGKPGQQLLGSDSPPSDTNPT